MKIKPLNDRVVVKPDAPEETTKSGIIIPDAAKERPQRGTVVAVGDGKFSEAGVLLPPLVREGDKVLYGKYSGTESEFDGEDVLIMRESDIFATIND
jgi:chaperonin GroES